MLPWPEGSGGLSTRPRLKSRTTKLSRAPRIIVIPRRCGRGSARTALRRGRANPSVGVGYSFRRSCFLQPLDNERPDQETSTIDRWDGRFACPSVNPGQASRPVPTERGPHGDDQGRTVRRRDGGPGHAVQGRRDRLRRPAPPGGLARRAGHRLPGAGRHHRRVADAGPRGARARHRRRGRAGAPAASRSCPAPAPTARARPSA